MPSNVTGRWSMPSMPGDREAVDVGVDDADLVALRAEGERQVDRQRRLADAALAGRHRDHAGAVVDREALALARLRAAAAQAAPTARARSSSVMCVNATSDAGDALDLAQLGGDVALDLRLQRAPGHGQRDQHGHAALVADLDVRGPCRARSGSGAARDPAPATAPRGSRLRREAACPQGTTPGGRGRSAAVVEAVEHEAVRRLRVEVGRLLRHRPPTAAPPRSTCAIVGARSRIAIRSPTARALASSARWLVGDPVGARDRRPRRARAPARAGGPVRAPQSTPSPSTGEQRGPARRARPPARRGRRRPPARRPGSATSRTSRPCARSASARPGRDLVGDARHDPVRRVDHEAVVGVRQVAPAGRPPARRRRRARASSAAPSRSGGARPRPARSRPPARRPRLACPVRQRHRRWRVPSSPVDVQHRLGVAVRDERVLGPPLPGRGTTPKIGDRCARVARSSSRRPCDGRLADALVRQHDGALVRLDADQADEAAPRCARVPSGAM